MARHNPNRWPQIVLHRGRHRQRLQFSQRETAFAEAWEQQNSVVRWLNFGRGTLQGLFQRRDSWEKVITDTVINNRDAHIVATVIQWLGTNCGMSFLDDAFRACGYRIVRDETWFGDPDCCRLCGGRGRRARINGEMVCGWCRYPLVQQREKQSA